MELGRLGPMMMSAVAGAARYGVGRLMAGLLRKFEQRHVRPLEPFDLLGPDQHGRAAVERELIGR